MMPEGIATCCDLHQQVHIARVGTFTSMKLTVSVIPKQNSYLILTGQRLNEVWLWLEEPVHTRQLVAVLCQEVAF